MSKTPKILIISTFDLQGGAARAAYRLFSALRKNGADAKMVVRKKSDDNKDIIAVNKSIPSQTLAELRYLHDKLPLFFYRNREPVIFSTAVAGDNVIDIIEREKPDLVHLHWINRGFLKLSQLKSIKVPVLWSMHDMWPFTGGCHYNQECTNFLEGCGKCPILRSVKKNDAAAKGFQRKKSVYREKKVTFIGLSKWLAESAKKSALLGNQEVLNLPNPIDTDVYKPIDKATARKILNFGNKPLILFGAMDATGEKRKGFLPLLAALKSIDINKFQIKVTGSTRSNSDLSISSDIQYLGNINDDITMALLYSAADVTIVPSLQENLSNVIMESLSCGTPVVAFDTGGNGDMIVHRQNGYLANLNDPEDLANGIKWVTGDPERWIKMSEFARNYVLQNYDENLIAGQYMKLYNQILNAV